MYQVYIKYIKSITLVVEFVPIFAIFAKKKKNVGKTYKFLNLNCYDLLQFFIIKHDYRRLV